MCITSIVYIYYLSRLRVLCVYLKIYNFQRHALRKNFNMIYRGLHISFSIYYVNTESTIVISIFYHNTISC